MYLLPDLTEEACLQAVMKRTLLVAKIGAVCHFKRGLRAWAHITAAEVHVLALGWSKSTLVDLPARALGRAGRFTRAIIVAPINRVTDSESGLTGYN